jgi:primosomal protein N' (replication factor Y) (superfamily II helicase)|uniref:primosomal protein N' n=1 Tax=Orrella sp. TaxID=1921583 RepID=UPI004047B1A0
MANDVMPALTDSAPQIMYVQVALDVPLEGPFDYACEAPIAIGARVIVTFGRRRMVGVVVSSDAKPSVSLDTIRSIERVLSDLLPLPESWVSLSRFAAHYYQRPLGEVMLPALPVALRRLSHYEGKRSGDGPVAKWRARRQKPQKPMTGEETLPELNRAQLEAVQAVVNQKGFGAFLLHGITGSGKTQVYLSAASAILERGGRVLFLVPEINLTPQFAGALQRRLGHVVPPQGVAIMHSGLSDSERLDAWLRTVEGGVQIVLGTRLAVFAPMPRIDLIVVDEEHDPSYKQQEGLRYSARDLAIWRAQQSEATIVLGSATPSLESWHKAKQGHYQFLSLPERATQAALPEVRLIDTRRLVLINGLAPVLIQAIEQTLSKGQQVLIYLNRRGYAPVMHCTSCGWVSSCEHCSAFSVLHRSGANRLRLHCHHCGSQRPAPAACPSCGDQDLQPMGRGTQRLEEHLGELFPAARLARIDADSTRRKGSAQTLFDKVHAGEVDILIGTQMVSKGHDFENLGLVGVLNADAMLFSQDFRAPERLFAQLMQVTGRAGRHEQANATDESGARALVLIQTGYPEQPVYQALRAHNFSGFATSLLKDREDTGLPPFAFQALLTAEASELPQAVDFLQSARNEANSWLAANDLSQQVTLYDAVPLRVVRVASVCRAQLLIESATRGDLHKLLRAWLPRLGTRHGAGRLRWQIEVDPLEI